jgi:predicted protein tyrosine phosphatase
VGLSLLMIQCKHKAIGQVNENARSWMRMNRNMVVDMTSNDQYMQDSDVECQTVKVEAYLLR